ncbi:protein DOWN-REGULATED IN DIF1 11-like [Raphanus sativus]|uniref:Protein DOWN-REGULATED IN DIF1 11-like n=1 Tax=Raphanus sativus TaxID=3726 RepID=A0A9W3C5P5_RAPSA|nr:protein DOWN-REGULATED IN DIF1 11-like [Raphanus sativus]
METKTIFMAFFIITTLVSYVYPSLCQEDIDNEPLVNPGREFDALDAISPASEDYNNYMLENLPPRYKTYIETCMENMVSTDKGKCGGDVLKEILTNEPVSRECCLKVVRGGKECYMEINKLMFRFYQLKRFSSQASSKINEVWNRCSAEVESSSSHDVSI